MSLSDISSQLTKNHLDDFIRQQGGVKHTSWEFAGNSFKKGDSYLSNLFRIIVKGVDDKGEEIEASVVIKSIPKNLARRLTFRSPQFFKNEANFYNIILKAFYDVQAVRKSVLRPLIEIPKCYLAFCDGTNDFVAMHDLSLDGYQTATRQSGMDVNLVRLIMQTLGRLHGMTFVMKDQAPKVFEQIKYVPDETYYAASLKYWYNDFMKQQIVAAEDAVSQEYGGTEVETRMRKFLMEGDLYDKMVKLTHTTNNYSVFGHGDCWTPNFLFHFEEVDGKQIPVSAKMIDFQLARFGSPALDISFFIYSCTTEELREQYYDDLLKAYHDSLSDLVKDFGSSPDVLFPFSALLTEMKNFGRFGVGMGIESIPFSLMEDSETADLDAMEGDQPIPITNVWTIGKIKDQAGRRRLADIFKHASDKGYLD